MPVIAGSDKLNLQTGGPITSSRITPTSPSVSQTSTQEFPRGKFWSGGFLSKVGDILGAPLVHAPFGFASGGRKVSEKMAQEVKTGQISKSRALAEFLPRYLAGGVKEIPSAIQRRFSGADYLEQIGVPEGPKIGIETKKPSPIGLGVPSFQIKPKIGGESGIPARELGGLASELAIMPTTQKALSKLLSPVGKLLGKLGPVIEPIIKSKLVGKLTPAEVLRAEQVAKGGISIGAGEEKVRKATQPLGTLIKEKIPFLKAAAEKLPQKYLGGKATTEAERYVGAEVGQSTGKILTEGFNPNQQKIMGSALKNNPVDWVGVTTKHGKEISQKMQTTIGLARRTMDDVSRELVSELRAGGMGGGIGRKETATQTILDNIGKYFPREYRKYIENPDNLVDLFINPKRQRMILNHLKQRKDIPVDVRKAMGEILEPGLPFAKTITEVKGDIALSKFFRFVNQHFADVIDRSGDLSRLPETSKLGVLSGKYVPRIIANDLKVIIRVPAKGAVGKAQALYSKLLSSWKIGKVILNPATHGRNIMSNTILMDLGGFPVWSPKGPIYFSQALKEMTEKGAKYQLARKMGLTSGTYQRAELQSFLTSFEKSKGNLLQRATKAGVGKAAKIYQAEEETGKMAMFLWRLDEGDNAMAAVKYAQKWLFNYRDIPEVINWLRNIPFGYPFIVFPYKALPRFVEATTKTPTSVLKYYRAFNAIEGKNRANEEAALPEYIRNGYYVRLPWTQIVKDAQGVETEMPLYLDLNYILPWGDIGEMGSRGIRKFLPQDPMANLVASLMTNKDPWSEQPIWKETDTGQQKTIKLGNYLYRMLMPPLAPEIPLTGIKGGYSWDKIFSAIARRPTEYRGLLRDIPSTFIDVGFGLKTTPIDIQKGVSSRVYEEKARIDEIKANIRSIGRMQGITEEEREKRIQKEIQKLEKETQRQEEIFKGFGPTLQPQF